MSSEYVFTWRIKNYSLFYEKLDEFIKSPSFLVDNLPGKWSLYFYPKGRKIYNKDFHDIFLYLNWDTLNTSVKTVTISCSLEIMSEDNSTLKIKNMKDKILNQDSPNFGCLSVMKIDELDRYMNSWREDVLTLKCRIEIDKQSKHLIVGSSACTTISVDRFCFDWNIEIPSLFECSDKINVPFLDLDFSLTSTREDVAIFINFKKLNSDKERLSFKISVFDKTGCELAWKRAVNLCAKNGETWKFPDLITKEILKSCEMNSFQYELKLKCEICISMNNIASSYIERLEFVSPFNFKAIPRDKQTSALQEDFRKLFNSKNYSDITIRSKNGDFPAHKLALRARSPVFAAMFDQDMLENKTGVVDVSDLDGETLKSFLQFLYTDTVDNMDYDIAKNLILTADKYQVPPLVDYCASFLKLNVSVKNVCEMIAIADMIGCESLKSYTLNFIKVNSSEILSSSEWIDWIEGNTKLASHILLKLSDAISKVKSD